MPFAFRIILFAVFLFLMDWYFYQSISIVFKGSSAAKRLTGFYIYWGFTALSFLVFLIPVVIGFNSLPQFVRVYVIPFFVLIIISKIIGSVFIAVDDIIRLFR